MHHLLSSRKEEKSKHQHMLEKFDKLSRQNSNSVHDLVTLAAQIVHPPPEGGYQRGYWSNPEDQVITIELTSCRDSIAPFTLVPLIRIII